MITESINLELTLNGGLRRLRVQHTCAGKVVHMDWYTFNPENGLWWRGDGLRLPDAWASIPNALLRANGVKA